jgi:hypothetical protein
MQAGERLSLGQMSIDQRLGAEQPRLARLGVIRKNSTQVECGGHRNLAEVLKSLERWFGRFVRDYR